MVVINNTVLFQTECTKIAIFDELLVLSFVLGRTLEFESSRGCLLTNADGSCCVWQANANLNELAKRLKQSETLNIDLQRRVDELNNELQVAHSDGQRMQAELARLRVSVGELQERSDALARENKQLSGKFVTLKVWWRVFLVAAFVAAYWIVTLYFQFFSACFCVTFLRCKFYMGSKSLTFWLNFRPVTFVSPSFRIATILKQYKASVSFPNLVHFFPVSSDNEAGVFWKFVQSKM